MARCSHGTIPQFCDVCKVEIKRSQKEARARAKANPGGRKSPENSSTFFKHPWNEWFEMCDAGQAILLDCAARRELTTYPRLWDGIRNHLQKDIGHPWRQIPSLLEYISGRSYEGLGLFITALVVDELSGVPNEGFFRLAAARGALPERDAPPVGEPWNGITPAQRAFWESQADALFEKFQNA
jgi:hypothetical protein